MTSTTLTDQPGITVDTTHPATGQALWTAAVTRPARTRPKQERIARSRHAIATWASGTADNGWGE